MTLLKILAILLIAGLGGAILGAVIPNDGLALLLSFAWGFGVGFVGFGFVLDTYP